MKIFKIPNLENNEIKVKEYNKPKFNVPIFQPYFRLSVSGSSGTGKTNAICRLYEKMKPQLDKTFVVSASYYNDPKQIQTFGDNENVEIFTEPSVKVLREIIEKVENINDSHKEFLKVKKAFDKWIEYDMNENILKPADLLLLYKYDFNPKNCPYNKELLPNIFIFLDDLQGLDILKHKIFENFVIKCRHHRCSLGVSCQTWKGVSPVFRRNCSCFMIFKTIDHNQLKDIFEEIQGLFDSYEDFLKYYNMATDEKHNFLYIDMNDKKAPIRKNFNMILSL